MGAFIQSPPRLGNTYDDDRFLRTFLKRMLPVEVLEDVEPELRELGWRAGDEWYDWQLAGRLNEPVLTQWDAWGNRIDRIEVSPLWQALIPVAAVSGLTAIPYERRHGRYSRLHQFAAVYLFHPSSDLYTCPLAMTDGAAHISDQGLTALARRALAAVEHAMLTVQADVASQIRQAGARRLALTIGRALELALLVEHAQWLLDSEHDPSGVIAAHRFAESPIDVLCDVSLDDARTLMDFL